MSRDIKTVMEDDYGITLDDLFENIVSGDIKTVMEDDYGITFDASSKDIASKKIKAKDGDGLRLEDDEGNGITILDGGNIELGGNLDAQGTYQITDLTAPSASGEAIRQTTNITEENLEELTDGSTTSLHDHAGGEEVSATGTPMDNDFAKFTDSTTIEGRSYAEVASDIEGSIDHGMLSGLSDGSDHSYIDQDVTVDSSPTLDGTNFTGIPSAGLDAGVGIADDNIVEIDDADAADNDFAKFTASGLEGRSYSEVKSDLSLDNVPNTGIAYANTIGLSDLDDLEAGGKITSVTDPTSDQDAATKKYVDDNESDTTYVSSDFTHDDLTGFVGNEHIDWTSDQGATNIHTGNYTDTTYLVQDGGLTQKNFTTTLKNKLDGIDFSANDYTHPSYDGDDFGVDTGVLSGATVVSDVDINITTDASGHVTDANGSISTRNLTKSDISLGSVPNTNIAYANTIGLSDLDDLDAGNSKITSVTDPTSNQEVATKKYVDDNSGGGGDVSATNSPVDNDFAKFTNGTIIEGRSYSEVRTDINVADGADVTANNAPQSHTVVSHNDTTATGSELNELTDGSTTTLHDHAEANILSLTGQSSDPANPSTGNAVMWLSDGTGSGNAGDLIIKTNVSGVIYTDKLNTPTGDSWAND